MSTETRNGGFAGIGITTRAPMVYAKANINEPVARIARPT
jgi:hypothetical protein